MNTVKFQLAVLACIGLLGACQTQNPSPPNVARPSSPSTTPAASAPAAPGSGSLSINGVDGWTVNKSLVSPAGDGALSATVCLVKVNGKWTVPDSPRCGVEEAGHESVFLSFPTKTITLNADRPAKTSTLAQRNHTGTAADATEWECYYGVMGSGSRTNGAYNVCASDFVSNSDAASSAFGSIGNLAFGTVRSVVSISAERILGAVSEANAIAYGREKLRRQVSNVLKNSRTIPEFEAALGRYESYFEPGFRDQQQALYRKDVETRQTVAYRQAFETARSAEDFRRFATIYASFDPDNLIPTALAKAAALDEQAQRDVQAAEKQRQVAEAQMRASLAAFRSKLAVGDTTHCGLVVAVNGPVVKVQSQIGEYWLKRDRVYREGEATCRFVNGVYQD